ncbi:hypothetical protein PIB30_000204 [Stylosanthes scabra]|uniref:Uncharacterized protein n=1 Tax=Stylosanthes scabra TaxID=79078 RepID=A0ABU6S262_9FABA|nr:hypothetical protein [Stylosanthes scabra]
MASLASVVSTFILEMPKPASSNKTWIDITSLFLVLGSHGYGFFKSGFIVARDGIAPFSEFGDVHIHTKLLLFHMSKGNQFQAEEIQAELEFASRDNWQVAAGEESKEKMDQKLREMEVLEAVYPRISAISPRNIIEPGVTLGSVWFSGLGLGLVLRD